MAVTFRLSDELQAAAKLYAERVGISVNALMAVALREYLDARSAVREVVQVPPPVGAKSKPGRNDPCSCGSGKKFKLCHGRA